MQGFAMLYRLVLIAIVGIALCVPVDPKTEKRSLAAQVELGT